MAGEATAAKAVIERSESTNGLHEYEWPRDAFGTPLLRVSYAASELVPTVQYGNAQLGPAQIVGFIPDGPDEQVLESARRIQRLVDQLVGEDRERLVLELKARAAAGQPAR